MASNKILNKYTLLLIMTLNLGFSAVPTIGMDSKINKKERNTTTIHLTSAPILKTEQEVDNYTNVLIDLCNKKEYEKALHMAFPEPIIEIEEIDKATEAMIVDFIKLNIPKEEALKIKEGILRAMFDRYHYDRADVLSTIYRNMGDDNQLNQEKAQQYYCQSIEYTHSFLSLEIDPFVPQRYYDNKTINKHRALISLQEAKAASQLANLLTKLGTKNDTSARNEVRSIRWIAIGAIERAFDYMKMSQLPIFTENSLLEEKYHLFSEYFNVISLCEDKVEKKKAKESIIRIHSEFKNNQSAKKYLKNTTNAIATLKEMEDRDNYLQAKPGSKEVERIRKKNHNIRESLISEKITNINREQLSDHVQKQQCLQAEIVDKHVHWHVFAEKNLQNSDIILSLKEIEREIQQQLITSDAPSTLLNVYQKYEAFLGGDILRKDIMFHILPAFLYSGDVEGALERVVILAQLEHQKLGNNSNLTLCLRAAIKNLNGDHEEWEAFEQKMTSTWENLKKEKEATKKRKQQEYAGLIRDRQILPPPKSNNNKQEQKLQQNVMHTKEEKPALFADQENSYDPLMTSLPLKEEKEEKKKRHAEAEKQREAHRNESTSIILNEKKSQDTISTTSQASIENAPPTIKDLYLLTSVAQDVDSEIENNTWTFSRENLMMYFEALDCTATDGGKHKKVSLPKAAFVFYEGSTIAIFNELGGALTLPRWDGSEGNGQVPSYLRKQILKAREKLVLLKLKANNATNNIITNSK